MANKHVVLTLSSLALGLGVSMGAVAQELTAADEQWCQEIIETGDIDALMRVAEDPSDPRSGIARECLALLTVPAQVVQAFDAGDGLGFGLPY